MGNRANVLIEGVFLYGHWCGHDLPSKVQVALARRLRWTDGAYLARIIFDEMTAGHHGEETGFGISASMQDNERAVVVVDVVTATVRFGTEKPPHNCKLVWTFEEFIALEAEKLQQAWDSAKYK